MSSTADKPASTTPEGHSPADSPGITSAEAGRWTDVSSDDRDEGWGERTESLETLTDDWYLSERPPHHG